MLCGLAVKDAERIMVDFGYPQNLLHTMKDAQKLELASKIKLAPNRYRSKQLSAQLMN